MCVRRHRRPSRFALSLIAVAVVSCVADSSPAQTAITFTQAKSSLWNDPTALPTVTFHPNWSPSSIPPAPPNSSSADVLIPATRTVDVNGVFAVGRLDIDPTATVNVLGGLSVEPGSFTGSGLVTNDGAVNLPAGIAFGNGHTGADVTVTGSGSITLAGGILGPNNTGYNGRLINASNTISGHGNIGQTFAGGGRISFTNQSLVHANVPFTGSNALTWAITSIDGPSAFGANADTLRASNGALFNVFGGLLENAGGTLQAQNASTIRLGTLTINSGTLTTSGTGVIESTPSNQPTLATVTNAGLFRVVSGSTVTLSGATHNTGTFAVSSAPGGTSILNGTSATLTGGGTVQFEGSNNDNASPAPSSTRTTPSAA